MAAATFFAVLAPRMVVSASIVFVLPVLGVEGTIASPLAVTPLAPWLETEGESSAIPASIRVYNEVRRMEAYMACSLPCALTLTTAARTTRMHLEVNMPRA